MTEAAISRGPQIYARVSNVPIGQRVQLGHASNQTEEGLRLSCVWLVRIRASTPLQRVEIRSGQQDAVTDAVNWQSTNANGTLFQVAFVVEGEYIEVFGTGGAGAASVALTLTPMPTVTPQDALPGRGVECMPGSLVRLTSESFLPLSGAGTGTIVAESSSRSTLMITNDGPDFALIRPISVPTATLFFTVLGPPTGPLLPYVAPSSIFIPPALVPLRWHGAVRGGAGAVSLTASQGFAY